MASSNFLIAKSYSLDYIRQVQANLDPKTYHKFIQTLKQFRHRNIHSSIAVVTITNLFRDHHPQLLLEFERNFIPATYTAAAGTAAADEADSVDFLKRVEARLKLGRNPRNGDYRKFLSLLVAYSKGEIAVSDVRRKVAGIFHRHRDLAAEFVSNFLPPESCPDAAAAVPPNKRRRVKTKIKKEDYFAVEDKLSYLDVQIGRLTATCKQAVDLTRRLTMGSLSAAEVRLEEHFDSPLYLIGIKRMCKELKLNINVDDDEDICRAMPQLIEKMEEELVNLKTTRVDLVPTMQDYLRSIDF